MNCHSERTIKKLSKNHNARRRWTEEETLYLMEHWGCKSGVSAISKALGRSEGAIKIRAQRLNLGPFIEAGEYVSFNVLYKVVIGESKNGYTHMLERWQSLGLPIKLVRVQKNKFRMVSIDDFWKWAFKHQRYLDFSRFEENMLGAEPEWAKKKRIIDIENRKKILPKKCTWSHEELERLRWLIEHGATYEDIENELKRSSAAIRRKIYDLYLDHPARCKTKAWSESETSKLIEMTERGYSQDYIASTLHRSAQSIRGKTEFLRNRGQITRHE